MSTFPPSDCQGPLDVPTGCLLSGLELSTSPSVQLLPLSSDIIIQGHRIELGELQLYVYTVMGAHDNLEVKHRRSLYSPARRLLRTYVAFQCYLMSPPLPQISSDDSNSSFLNQTWNNFYSRTGAQ